ncbi:MAG TPA: heme o synthase [Candidatus Baltobacteraceae bacterium]|nr:heme o synthase [Candidatus Baltobacteraceae bacterium]
MPARLAWLATMLSDYYELGKPRIMYLLLVTTAAAMVMAQRGIPNLELLGWTMLAGALAAMSAGAFNCIYDMDIDRVMRRTSSRPLPSGRLTVFQATAHACFMGIVSFAIFFLKVDHLAAWLSLAGNVYYVVIYTMLLKRRTAQNIVIGGAAGSIPPLVGWAAVTHSLGAPAIGLFAIIFLWTPPHFWALALMTETDYHKAGIPMLPNVRGDERTKLEIWIYSLILAGASLLLYWPLHVMGPLYAVSAAVLGFVFLRDALNVKRETGSIAPRRLFLFSLIYLAAICAAMVLDRLIF